MTATALLPPMKWNAWGDPAEAKPLSDGIRALLKQALGVDDARGCRAGARRRSGCGRRRCRAADRDGLAEIVGAEYCGVDDRARLLRAGGKSTLDLLRRKDTGVQDAPDAVLLPGDEDEIAAISAGTARQRSIAVVPFGGGTSVVGGLDPVRGDFKAVISLDLRRLNELHSLDEVSGEAELGAGRHRAGRRTPARRTRLLARALPAELPVRDHRRVRRDPLVRPGLGGLRPLQRHGPRPARGHAGGRARPRPCAGVGGRPGPAATADRLRGRVRRHHPRARAGAPDAGGHPLRGVVVPRLRHRRRRAARRRADRHRARPSSGCPTKPRPASTWPPPRASARTASPAAAWRSPCSRAPRRTSRAGTPRPAR